MTSSEIAAKLRELAQEAGTLQQHLRQLLGPVSLQDPATARRLEDALRELERLASKTAMLAALAEAQ
jgi:DNA-binding ferritin-like protein